MCQGLLPSRRHIEKREDPGDEVGVFLAVLRVFRGIMGCYGVLWDVPGVFRAVPGCSRGVPGCSGGVPGCSGFYRHPSETGARFPA